MFAVRTLAVMTLCLALSPAVQAGPATHKVAKPKLVDRMIAFVYWQGNVSRPAENSIRMQ